MGAEREWDAARYHELSEPQFAWGRRVLARAEFRGDERVLDAGCGSGRLTLLLRDRVPRGEVVALDLSERMARAARDNLVSGTGAAASAPAVLCADLLAIPFVGAFDVIFSTATFHWVLDASRLHAELFATLRPGGRLIAQCGGGANLERTLARARTLAAAPAFASHFRDWHTPWRFDTVERTESALRDAGFTRIRCWLEDAPTTFADASTYRAFLETVVMRRFLAALPGAALRDRFLDELTEDATRDDPPLTLEYQRLNIDAARP